MPSRLIIIIATIIAALAVGFIFTLPKFQDLQQVLSQVQQKELELSSKAAYYSKINEIRQELEKYNDVLPRVDAAIPDSYSIPDLFYYLQRTAGEAGLVVKNLAFEGASSGKVKEIGLGLQASGNYDSLASFVSALENSARLFKIQNVSFSSPKEGNIFSFNLTITAYSY